MVSIIIPVYNEQNTIQERLENLSCLHGDFEVIVSDGASTDQTARLVREALPRPPYSLRLVSSIRHRARQLNHAAAAACGDVLLFLHADACLPGESLAAIERALASPEVVGGNFELRFEGNSWWSRVFTWVNRARRAFGIYYGDSAVFVRREVFERLGGFKPIPIMEDYDFVRRLERCGRTVCLAPAVVVSDRRWRVQGVFRTLASWFWVQALYSAGVSPERLARWYKPVRASAADEHSSTRIEHQTPKAFGPRMNTDERGLKDCLNFAKHWADSICGKTRMMPSNPSPGPLRLVKAPSSGPPPPAGREPEIREFRVFSRTPQPETGSPKGQQIT